MKKIIAIFLVTALMLCGSLSVGAATVYRYGDWTLTATQNESVVFGIRSYDGSDEVVTVPRDYGGYPITAINAYAFAGNNTLQELMIGDNITSIGEDAFMSCTSLSKVYISDSVTEIGDDAFLGSDNVVIYGTSDSYAVAYAKEYDINYVLTDVETYVSGDTDGDNLVTILDVTLIQRYLVMLKVPDPQRVIKCGDITGDGLDVTDATFIQRYIAEMTVPYAIGVIIE